MASQVFDLGSQPFGSGNDTVWTGAILVDTVLVASGAASYLRQVDPQLNQVTVGLRFADTATGAAILPGPDLTPEAEVGSFTLSEAGGSSVTFIGPNDPAGSFADPNDPYLWRLPSDGTAVYDWLQTLGTGVVTLTIDDGQVPPDDPSVLIDTAAQEVDGGDLVNLAATVTDPQDPLADLTLLWTATGGTFADDSIEDAAWTAPAATLQEQAITLTLTATDTDGNSASASVVFTVPARDLVLADFSQDDREFEMLALIEAAARNDVFQQASLSARGTLVDGEVGIGPDETILNRIRITTSATRIILREEDTNADGDAAVLDSRDYFINGDGSDLTIGIMTRDGSVNIPIAANLDTSSGTNATQIRVDIPSADRSVVDGIGDGDRFIIALWRIPSAVNQDAAFTARAGDPTASIAAQAQAITNRDAAFAARAGNPTATIAGAANPVTDRDTAFSARAGDPTASIAANVQGITNRDAGFTARAGTPTAAMAAEVVTPPLPEPTSSLHTGIAVPLVHLGWNVQAAVSGHAVAALNGLYSLGALDGETTKVSGPAPAFHVTYDDGTDEWIVLTVDGASRSQRAIADGDSGAFTDFSNTAPTGDIEYALAIVSGALTMTANGQVLNVGTLGDASGGTLTLYAEPDTAKNQRVQLRSSTEDFDWYADVPFLRLDANPRVPLVDSRSSVTSGKDSLRALNPFRVPDGNLQLRITADEFLAEEWQVDFPVAIVEAYNDGSGAVTYRSQLVGRVETPQIRGNPPGVLCVAETDRKHGRSAQQHN